MDKYTDVLCPRCGRLPQNSRITNRVFTLYICYEDCGNIFWTQRQCPSCKMQNFTNLTSKPKTGEMVKCGKCSYECFYFRCPLNDCRKIMVKEGSKYRMGWPTSCDQCGKEFKLIVCSCGGEIYFEANQIVMEGANEYPCKQCKKSVCYLTCPQPDCLLPTYVPEALEVGEKTKCNHCKQIRYFVPCPECGHSIYSKNFVLGERQTCNYCSCQFEYIACPNGCGLNGYMGTDFDSAYRRCNRACKVTFILLHCNKCKYPLYVEDYEFGYWREDQCPACKSQIKFHLCQCGNLNKDQNKCSNPMCPIPKACRNYSKMRQESTNKKVETKNPQNSDYDEKQCKLCYDMNSCMVNEECRHMMMCQICYRNIRQREGDQSKCPICKRPGKYHKYVQPILQ